MAGRGRDAVLPSWMTSNGTESANSYNPPVSSHPSEQYHGDSASKPIDAPSTPRDFEKERDSRGRDRDRDRDRDRYENIYLATFIRNTNENN